MRLAPDAGRLDTFFEREPFDAQAFVDRAERPRFGHPSTRFVGHYEARLPRPRCLARE